MQVLAIANNIRVTPQKVRLVVAQIKKMKPAKALEILEFTPQKAATPLKKAIMSAVANAKNNFNLDENSLEFASINVGKGMVFKRFRPVSRGRAHSILRVTSNIRIVLEGQETKIAKEPIATKEEIKEAKNGTKS